MCSMLTTFAERKNTDISSAVSKREHKSIFSNKDFMVFLCDIFISIWKKFYVDGPAKRKIKLVWPNVMFCVYFSRK